MKFRISAAIVALLSASAWAGGQPAAPAVFPDDFVTRSGTQPMLNGQPFRFTGVNIYNANNDGWCDFEYTDQQFDQTLSDLGPGKEVIRAWFFQSLATENGQRDWSPVPATAVPGPGGTLTASGLPAGGETSVFSNSPDSAQVMRRTVRNLSGRDFRVSATASRAGSRVLLVTPNYFAHNIRRHGNRFGELTTYEHCPGQG